MKRATTTDLMALKRKLNAPAKPQLPYVAKANAELVRQAKLVDLAGRITLLGKACVEANYVAIRTNRLELEKWIDANLLDDEKAHAKRRVQLVIAQVLERSSEVVA